MNSLSFILNDRIERKRAIIEYRYVTMIYNVNQNQQSKMWYFKSTRMKKLALWDEQVRDIRSHTNEICILCSENDRIKVYSLLITLFRTVNICDGGILIDNVDITGYGRSVLWYMERAPFSFQRWNYFCFRQTLVVIPQDPLLFSGIIRVNLDPYKQYTDERDRSNIRQLSSALFRREFR